ncbi:MAG: hypothetical protein EAZ25_07110 [Oscillatoriales cyanobacterium]|nr:MAG: hypothetical protein EAZ88_08515 [Oscillatoriales cyanobacterium]TAE71779.1 MAG: hypothetical protein EAZ86_01330 [Oscillatoriales cyanobacterium]TAG06433.1 MAG: hypothetical protein EAZ45_04665 [Oscillatoriales cyanobacterium]TAG59378.1 MAG: hypothetical protein EAZ28_11520 [Oscillatoriales cyanobacterium]TAG67557.1 MAG: hypothetical protein EAZ25_07110 [Oscillatoriales cyanobacterium]
MVLVGWASRPSHFQECKLFTLRSKTEIYRRQLVATQNIDLAELYHEACHTLLPVIALVKFDAT